MTRRLKDSETLESFQGHWGQKAPVQAQRGEPRGCDDWNSEGPGGQSYEDAGASTRWPGSQTLAGCTDPQDKCQVDPSARSLPFLCSRPLAEGAGGRGSMGGSAPDCLDSSPSWLEGPSPGPNITGAGDKCHLPTGEVETKFSIISRVVDNPGRFFNS